MTTQTSFLVFIALLGFSAWAKVDFSPKPSKFIAICREHRWHLEEISAPEVGVSDFFPVRALQASQTRYSHERMIDSLHKLDPDSLFSHDNGRAIYGMEKKIKAVFYRGQLFIVDGHHRALISTYLGARTIPVKIEDDLSWLSPAQFKATMEMRGWGYWRDFREQEMPIIDLCDMEDDPNFQLARLIIRRVDVVIEEGELRIQNSRGADRPVAIKINSDVPFLENKIADALRRGGVAWNGEDITKKDLYHFAEILRGRLPKVLLLDKPRNVAKLDIEQLVMNHLRKCERDLLK